VPAKVRANVIVGEATQSQGGALSKPLALKTAVWRPPLLVYEAALHSGLYLRHTRGASKAVALLWNTTGVYRAGERQGSGEDAKLRRGAFQTARPQNGGLETAAPC
jgi:hypothetical protein